jgi:drug/metabolite transporter (DMT)-like permease
MPVMNLLSSYFLPQSENRRFGTAELVGYQYPIGESNGMNLSRSSFGWMSLSNLLPVFAWLLLSATFFAIGEYWSKRFAIQPNWKLLMLVCSTYLLGTLAWLPAIVRTKELSTTGTGWLLLSMLATLAIGFGIFHEKVNSVQIAGIILAIFALILLNYRR